MSELDKGHPLRRRYYRRVRNAFFVAVALHLLAFALAPSYRPRTPVMRPDPIHLLPAGLDLRSAAVTTAEAAPEVSGVVAPEHPLGSVVPAAPGVEIRSEQLPPGEAPPPAERGGQPASGGQLEGEAPPVYYGYDTAPRAIRSVTPAYPPAARSSGFEGTVVINVNLDERGHILRAWVASASAPELLISTALDAVYQFEFAPGYDRGVAVKSTVAIPFRFTLKRTA